jgi:hypothetical protein
MKMLKKICAATLVYGLTVAPAMAEGFYAALDVGQTNAKDTCTTGTAGCNDSSTAIRAAGGYQFTRIWGARMAIGKPAVCKHPASAHSRLPNRFPFSANLALPA